MTDSLQALRDDFSVLDDWEDRYRYVIDLGKALPDMDPALKTAATKVSGCASQVWIHSRPVVRNGATYLDLVGDSDALIVKGLIAIAFLIFAPRPVTEIPDVDAAAIFADLGLREHLTPQRSNGLASMVARIKADAMRARPPAE
ncbi:MAG: SufE family protein [Rhizobiales bacterium]|nr:SufE family protein [Hyphomicrobiales bacterium]